MLSKNPLRTASLASPAIPIQNLVQQLTLPQLQAQLQTANDKIADLETRLTQLERSIYVAPNGDVEIYAINNLQLVAERQVKISGGESVQSDSQGSSLKIYSGGISITSSGKTSINASEHAVSVAAMTVNAGMATFTGTVKADTLIANSVVGSSYTPGAGNIW